MIKNRKKIYFTTIIFFLSLSLGLFYYSFIYAQKIIENSFFEQIKVEIKHLQVKIDSFYNEKKTLLSMLSTHEMTKNFILNSELTTEENLEQLFIDQLKSSNQIFQLRLLDLKGNELLRVDKNNNIIKIVDKNELQNKFSRNYFQQFLNLNIGNIGFSNLDLNIEFGRVETPFKPTLRMAMPVFIKDKKQAIIIINYEMNDFLNQIRNSSYLDMYLLDEEGYFILNPNRKLDWSKYKDGQIKANTILNIDTNNILAHEDFYKNGRFIGKPLVFWNSSKKILLYKEKDNLGVNSFLEKSKFLGLLILLGVLMPIVPIIIVIFSNLRTSKANQKKLKSILDNTFDAIIMINSKGLITTTNKSTLETFGYKEEELIGKNVNILVPQPYHDHHDGYLKSYHKDKHHSSKIIGADRELFGLHKNGTQIAISLAVTQCSLGEELFFIGSIRDISEQRKLKENEKAQELMLMQQSKLASMGEMVTAIAHQWRQPLNAIGLSIQDMVSAQKYGELDKEYVLEIKDDVTDQLKFMSETIDEFRNFFRQSNENIEFNLADLLTDVHKLLWTQLSSNSLILSLHVKKNNEILDVIELTETQKNDFKIFNKPSELKQILINLVLNAKDALLSNEDNDNVKKEIIIEVERIENKVLINVKDIAGGIDEKILNRIFEPYFTTKKMGTGLGLYICQMLAQKSLKSHITACKHEIQEDGKTFKGSIFSLSLDIKV